MKKINTLSLFSGAGGLDIGFHKAGFNIVACVELEEKYCRTLEANRKNSKYFNRETVIHNVDIRKFDVRPYLNKGIECVIGGPPCQTFSAAGRRAGGVIGIDDARGQLYETYCKILDKLKPKVFVFENVYGLPGANGGRPWREIQNAFSDHGYKLHAEVVDAADYGVPQHRERLVMIGTRGVEFVFPMPIVGPDSRKKKSLISVLDAIKDLQNPNEKYGKGLGGMYGHLLPEVPEGLNYAFFTSEMGHPEPVFAWRSKFHDLLYKVNRNEPCRTIKASPGKFTGPFHWKNRHFTISELKRLQTFPDDYELAGSYGQIVEQIGNSVPPQLAFVIAESVKEQILYPKQQLNFPVRPNDFKSTFRNRQRERTKSFKVVAQSAVMKKYGKAESVQILRARKPKSKEFYTTYNNRFERIEYDAKVTVDGQYLYGCITEIDKELQFEFETHPKKKNAIKINISINGLSKYLPKFDSLNINGKISIEENIFQCWKEIENILVERSKFFTLIDIYGHYANRGDVVKIDTKIIDRSSDIFWAFVNYFSQSENCGRFTTEDDLQNIFNITKSELYEVIAKMRANRYDIRFFKTHPIIGKANVICTYPFPLLSPKALVESKVRLINEFA